MDMLSVGQGQFIEWGVASRALPGQEVSGDLHLVTPSPHGMIAAVVDGLGHGEDATKAARLAIETLKAHTEESVIAQVRHCHRALQFTRGAVMTVMSFNVRESTVAALGIGNVEAFLLRANRSMQPARESVLLRGGVIGYQLPALYASVLPVYPGDLMIFATDGIQDGFAERIDPAEPIQSLVDRVLKLYFRGADDALVLAIRYLEMTRD